MNKIITIGREFGSGGREFGRRLAEELGIEYYDKEIIAAIAEKTSMSQEYVQEVLEGKPTAASVACEDTEVAEFVQKACNVPNRFRLYTNTDVIGVELGGSLKNVIAIASGFAQEVHL